jgi:hypothetical protein
MDIMLFNVDVKLQVKEWGKRHKSAFLHISVLYNGTSTDLRNITVFRTPLCSCLFTDVQKRFMVNLLVC